MSDGQFRSELMVDPDNARKRASNLLALGRVDDARGALGATLAHNPTDADALRLLAEIEMADDNLDEALDRAREAVSLSPGPGAFLVLANVERRHGDFAAAVNACEKGLNLSPDDAALHITRALAWSGPWLSADRDTANPERQRAAREALASATHARELDPERPNVHYAAAVAQLVHGDAFAAAKALDVGLAIDPEWVEGHLLMSAIRGRQGMPKLASRHLAIAGRLNPTNDDAIRRLRQVRGRSLLRRKPKQAPWWLAPEARAVLEADRRVGGQ